VHWIGQLLATLFEDAVEEVLEMLNKKFFADFLKSDEYLKMHRDKIIHQI
jgi:hypothetical protein